MAMVAKLQSPQFVSLRTKLEDCGSKIQQTEKKKKKEKKIQQTEWHAYLS